MKLKNAFLALALSCAVVLPLTACGANDGLKSQKQAAVEGLNESAVALVGDWVFSLGDESIVPVGADQSYVDTYAEAYDLLQRFPELKNKVDSYIDKQASYINAAKTIETLVEIENSALEGLEDVLTYSEYQKIANLALSINTAKNYLNENYSQMTADKYSANAFSALEDLHDDLLGALNNATDFRVIQNLVTSMDNVLEFDSQKSVSEYYINMIETELSDADIFLTYQENTTQVQALKNSAIQNIKNATTEPEMQKLYNKLFEDVEKIQTNNSDAEYEAYLQVLARQYGAMIDNALIQSGVAELPEYWNENWAQMIALTAKTSINKATSETDMQEIFSAFTDVQLAWVIEDYEEFSQELQSCKSVLGPITTANLIMTAQNKVAFDAIVEDIQEILINATDWDALYTPLTEMYVELSSSLSVWDAPAMVNDILYSAMNAYVLQAQFMLAVQDVFSAMMVAENYSQQAMLFDVEVFGNVALRNNFEDTLDPNFTKEQTVPFGLEKVALLHEEFINEIMDILEDVWGLTETESKDLIDVISNNPDILMDVMENFDGILAMAPQFQGFVKIFAAPENFEDFESRLVAATKDFVAQVKDVDNAAEDLVFAAQSLLEQINKDFSEETTYLPIMDMAANISPAKESLQYLIAELQAFDIGEYDSYYDFAEEYHDLLDEYKSIADSFYLSDEALIHNLLSAQEIMNYLASVLQSVMADMFSEVYIEEAEALAITTNFAETIANIQLDAEEQAAQIKQSTQTADEQKIAINLAYSNALDRVLAEVIALSTNIEENYITVSQYEELVDEQMVLFEDIKSTLQNFGISCAAAPITYEEYVEFFGDLSEEDLVLQNSAVLFNDFDLMVAVDSTQEIMTALQTHIEKILGAKTAEDLTNLADDFNTALATVPTIFDAYEQTIDGIVKAGCSLNAMMMLQSFISEIDVAKTAIFEGEADFATAYASIASDISMLAAFFGEEAINGFNQEKDYRITEIDLFDLANTNNSTIITLTEKQTQNAGNFIKSYKQTINAMKDIEIMVADFDAFNEVFSFIGEENLWLELAFNNYWNNFIAAFYEKHNINTTDLAISLAETFETDAEDVAAAITQIQNTLKIAKYSIWLNNDAFTQGTFVEFLNELNVDVLFDCQNLLMGMNTAEENLMEYKLSASEYVLDELKNISAPLKDQTYATILEVFEAVNAQIMSAENEDAIEGIKDEFITTILPALDDTDYFKGLQFDAVKAGMINDINAFAQTLAYTYNAANKTNIESIIAQTFTALDDAETQEDLEDIATAYGVAIGQIETLQEYYAYANSEVATFITALESGEYELGEDFATAEELIQTFTALANALVFEYDSIAAFDAALEALQTQLNEYIPSAPVLE
ncbi:MAG: hypothetical protein IKB21_02535 [Clostridia bacterium]|nr:hypothetical protein [Clostridia bacterium]